MSNTSPCWSCGEPIESSLTECPECGMPQDKVSSEDSMDFLDDIISSDQENSSQEDQTDDDFVLPDFDYVEGKSEVSSSPKGEIDQGYTDDDETDTEIEDVDLPDFDYIEGKKDVSSSSSAIEESSAEVSEEDISLPDITSKGETEDTSSSSSEVTEEQSASQSKLSEKEKSTMLDDMDSILTEPQKELPEEEKEPTTEPEKISKDSTADDEIPETVIKKRLRDIRTGKVVKMVSLQHVYWTIVYILIVFASYEVVNQNFNPISIKPTDFEISPIGFLAAWLSFSIMGWYFGYKLRRLNVVPKWKHGLFFIFTQFVFMFITSNILILILNPQYLFGNLIGINFLLTSYFMIIPYHYLMTGVTAGWFLFFISFKVFWTQIYKLSPMYDLKPSLTEL